MGQMLEQMNGWLSKSEAVYDDYKGKILDAVKKTEQLKKQILTLDQQEEQEGSEELHRRLQQYAQYLQQAKELVAQRIQVLEGLMARYQTLAQNTATAGQQLHALGQKRFGASAAIRAGSTAQAQYESCVQGHEKASRLKQKFEELFQMAGKTADISSFSVRAKGRQWQESLSAQEKSAVYDYTGEAYENINQVMRGQASAFAAGNRETAALLRGALSKAKIPEECVVYRGASLEALGAYQHLSDQELIGKTIRDRGFMSTSLREKDSFGGKVKLKITVPKGANGAYVGYISQYGHNESEVLFCDGQVMKITGVTRSAFGKRTIHARILLREGANE